MTTEYVIVDSCKDPNIFAGKCDFATSPWTSEEDIDGNADSALAGENDKPHAIANPWGVPVSGQTWMVWSFWVKPVQGTNNVGNYMFGGSDSPDLSINDSDAMLYYSTSQGLYVYEAYNTSVQLGVVFDYDTWYHIEYAHRFGSATTGDWIVYVNGNEVGSGVGDSDGEPWDYFVMRGVSPVISATYDYLIYDDIVLAISDEATAPRLGMLRVAHLLPTGTSQGQWTGSDGNSVDNHLLVDDDDAASADYVESTAGNNEVDLYTHGALPAGVTPVAVQVAAAANLDALGTDDFSIVVESNGSQVETPVILGTGAPTWKRGAPVHLDPDGNVAWTKAKVDASTFGVSS